MKIKNTYLITASILILSYLFFIIFITDFGQKRLLESQKNEIELELQNKLSTLDYLLKFQERDIDNLSKNNTFSSYFSNKALGMSMLYGLKANIIKIEKLMEDFLDNRKIEKNALFTSIALFDNENNLITQKNFTPNLKYVITAFDNNTEDKIITIFDENNLQLFFYTSIKEKDKKLGYLVVKMNVKEIFPKLFQKVGDKKEYLIYSNKMIDTSTMQLTSINITEDYVIKGFENINLFIGVNKKNILSKEIFTSKTFILILFILTFLVFLGILYLIKLNNKNISLSTQMHVKNQLNEKLESVVEEKTKELKDLNKNLEQKVEEQVTKNQENQRLLYHQSKMAAMGEMLGNIAHQWRQPLSSISSQASGIKLQKELNILDEKDLLQNMDDIVGCVNFLSDTITDFREFFKRNKEKSYFNLRQTYEKTYKLIASRLKNNNIEVFVNIDELDFYGYENELIQVLMNILNNANDALSENNQNMEKHIFIDFYKVKDMVVLKIKDNAGGIPDKIIEKIFDPYFTTKQESDGTGIGLYMTKEIIENHMKGEIFVSNVKYNFQDKNYSGAEFIIRLNIEEKNI